jgi:hypothetical protein
MQCEEMLLQSCLQNRSRVEKYCIGTNPGPIVSRRQQEVVWYYQSIMVLETPDHTYILPLA